MRPRKGFVLLMSLVFLTLAIVLLAGLARHSLTTAIEIDQAELALQHRWGVTTVTRSILPRAEQIIALRVKDQKEVEGRISECLPIYATIPLGDTEYNIRLDDEHRKLNVNRLYAIRGLSGTMTALGQLKYHTGNVCLRPSKPGPGSFTTRAFESYGQIYALDQVASSQDVGEFVMQVSESVSFAGNGRLHYQSAPDHVIQSVISQAIGPVTAVKLIEARDNEEDEEETSGETTESNPDEEKTPQLEKLLDGLDLQMSKRNRLRGWLTDKSNCYSLWIHARRDLFSSHNQTIMEVSSDDSYDMVHFSW